MVLEERSNVVDLSAVRMPAIIASIVRSEFGVGDAGELGDAALSSK